MANPPKTYLDDIFDYQVARASAKPDELVFHVPQPHPGNVFTFVRPSREDRKEDAPVLNSLTFEESDRPIRRFPQHLTEIMRRAEQSHRQDQRSNRGIPPVPLCGILTINEDSVAWVAVRGQFETTLVLFSANPEKSEVAVPATHVEVEDIVSVCAVPQPSADGANNLIAIATVSGVRLYRLLVCAASIVIDVSTNIFFSIPDVAVTSIVASDMGRLFAGCIDGWVYELQYIDNISSWWRPPKIRKVAPSISSPFPLVALSYVPAPLFVRDRAKHYFESLTKQWNHMPVVDMCVHTSSIVSPSKVFLWALEKQESEASSVASSQGKQYKSALQLYDVHASGLQLLDTLSEKAFKGEDKLKSVSPDTWMSKIFPVETWQEEEQEWNNRDHTVAVARVCVVLANGHRVFYKYDCSKKKFTSYSVHSKHFVSPDAPRNDDQPCCFVNGRFVRVNRDSSSVTSVYRSSFENVIPGAIGAETIPAVARTLRCAHPAGHKMQICVVAPVPLPSAIGRLIAMNSLRAASQKDQKGSTDPLVPRTVHDAFWQMHSEQQDYLIMYSYGSDRCGITLVREFSLRGRIRQAFRRQEAESYRSAIEDAFLGRSVVLSNQRSNDNVTTIHQSSLILATQLSLHIDCKLSGIASDLKLQESMLAKINHSMQLNSVIESNAWRFCVYNVLCPWYRVPLFSHSQATVSKGNTIVCIPTLALRDNPPHGWKYIHDFLHHIIEMTQHMAGKRVLEVQQKGAFNQASIVDALIKVKEIVSVLHLLTNLFRRAPPLLVATGIKRSAINPPNTLTDNTVEELLQSFQYGKAHHTLLTDVLEVSNFDAHMDQELRDHLLQFCPAYFREKQFLKAVNSLVVGGSTLDTSFRHAKSLMKTSGIMKQADCDSFEKQVAKLMSDHLSVLTEGEFDWPRMKSDLEFCAQLLGCTTKEYTPANATTFPEFWQTGSDPNCNTRSTTAVLWNRCHLQTPTAVGSLGATLLFPFLFQPPVRYLCMQLRRVLHWVSQNSSNDTILIQGRLRVSSNAPRIHVTDLYRNSLRQLLMMAWNQKISMSKPSSVQGTAAAIGSKLFQDAVEAALSVADRKCTEIVCDWLDCVASPKGGFKPLHVLHTYPDTEPLFAAIATSQYYPHVEEWISAKIIQPSTGSVSSDAAYYCCLLLEYLHLHNRWSEFCKKTLDIVNKKEFVVGLDHKIAWLNMALNCTNGRSLLELPQKVNFVDQIQLRLKVLHLHKLAYDRLFNLLTIPDGHNFSLVKRWAIHFRMWNYLSNSRINFLSDAGNFPVHKFEDTDHRGVYTNSSGCLRDGATPSPLPPVPDSSSMLGRITSTLPKQFQNGLLARYMHNLFSGEVSYQDHAFFRKILHNSMFFDLEIIFLHTVLPIQNQQEIEKCIQKMMIQSWFNDRTTRTMNGYDADLLIDPAVSRVHDLFPNDKWDDYCMRLDFDENYNDSSGWNITMSQYILTNKVGFRIAIESLRRDIHSFLEIAPKAQDTLRIMFPPEVLITFACRHMSVHIKSSKYLRHYVCAIVDILLGYTSPLDSDVFEDILVRPLSLLGIEKPHAFVSYNALCSDGYAVRTKGRDRCLSLRNLWDALPHICRKLPVANYEILRLGLAARLACETAASKRSGILQDGPAVDLAMQQYSAYHEHIKSLELSRVRAVEPDLLQTEFDLKQIQDLSEQWYNIIMRRA